MPHPPLDLRPEEEAAGEEEEEAEPPPEQPLRPVGAAPAPGEDLAPAPVWAPALETNLPTISESDDFFPQPPELAPGLPALPRELPPPKERPSQISNADPMVMRMFSKQKHLFIELHEFKGASWHETHRWNYGLQEDLVQNDDPERQTSRASWTRPHLPSGSLLGMMSLREALCPDLILLDPPPETGGDALEALAGDLIESLVRSRKLQPERASLARSVLVQHLRRKESAVLASYRNTPENEDYVEPLGEDDPLKPEENEETVHILIDSVDWLERDIVSFVRLCGGTHTGLEEDYSKSKARFIVVVLGPGSPTDPEKQIHMGEAAAALLQHDYVVQAAYGAQRPEDFLLAMEDCFKGMRLVPQTTHPTVKGVRHHAEQMLRQMAEIRQKKEDMRTQKSRWQARQHIHIPRKFSLGRAFIFAQQLALPLLIGIVIGLVWINTEPNSYDHWAGHGDHGPADGEAQHAHAARPTFFGLEVKGYPMTIHFLVNDIFMSLFFGLASKEITEAFQPGGSLYPPARSTVNVLASTVGGVAGPAGTYLAFVALFSVMGLLDENYSLADYAIGWGIPTATDIAIAWVAAVCVFGRGHPAIDFLLLLAVIDDGIGLLIIALAYPDPENPVKPVWLLLVLAASFTALILRKLHCGRWPVYILLAGPFSWAGLLKAGMHPSLALVAVVPFMPLHSKSRRGGHAHGHGGENGEQGDDGEDEDEKPEDSLLRMATDGPNSFIPHGRATLHEFEEALKPFVDFVVLFLFGVVNAGVQIGSTGALTIIILASLVVGKTMGISVASCVATCLGFPPPAGVSAGAIVMVGFIASAGLTVALFVAGEAFKQTPALMDQAKLGALLSVVVALVAIASSCVRPPRKHEKMEEEAEGGSAVDLRLRQKEKFAESLEEIVVKNTVQSLQMIHRAEKAVEETQADWGLAPR